MAKWILTLILPFLVLSGCRARDRVDIISTLTPTSTARPLTTPTRVPTVTKTPTATVSPEVMRYQCLKIAEFPPPDAFLKGVIAYNDDYNLYAYLSNQETNDTYLFPREEGDRLLGFEVSPDGKYILYDHYSVKANEDRLVIATAIGKPILSRVVDFSIRWSWFDNERLIRLEFLENGTRTLQLLNPFTREQQDLRTDFPNSEMFSDPGLHWRYSGGGLPIYDPTLTRVVYPATADQLKGDWPIVVWDLETDQMVTEIIVNDAYWGETPLWTPDGRQFIFPKSTVKNYAITPPPREFFAVSRDGEVRQLTHFADYFSDWAITGNYSMSPDGKLLAFWIQAQPSPFEDAQLAVMNIDTGAVTNYCIKGASFIDVEAEQETLITPIWSPDSTQLLVISRFLEDPQVRRVIMADIVNNYAAQINQDMEPVGWMVAP